MTVGFRSLIWVIYVLIGIVVAWVAAISSSPG